MTDDREIMDKRLTYTPEDIEKYGAIWEYAKSKGWTPKYYDYNGDPAVPFGSDLTSPDGKLRMRYRDVESGSKDNFTYDRIQHISLYSTDRGDLIGVRLQENLDDATWVIGHPETQKRIFDFYVDMLLSFRSSMFKEK